MRSSSLHNFSYNGEKCLNQERGLLLSPDQPGFQGDLSLGIVERTTNTASMLQELGRRGKQANGNIAGDESEQKSAISYFLDDMGSEATMRAHAICAEGAVTTANRLFELTGTRSTANTYRLDRFWRNARTFSLHDPLEAKLIMVGGYELNGELVMQAPSQGK